MCALICSLRIVPRRRSGSLPSKAQGPGLQTDSARSALMARVRQHGTDAEKRVAAALRALGHSYRLNVRSLPGSPDFANRRRRWAIFVHGCFWHQHTGCKRATVPTRNRKFWMNKFMTNRTRDARAVWALRHADMSVVIVWECETLDKERLYSRILKLPKPG